MKKNILYIFAFFYSVGLFAQSDYINFQAIIRDKDNKLLTNQNVTIRITLLRNSATGTILYRELHTVPTNDMGIATIQIGSGASQNGIYAEVPWTGTSSIFVRVDLDKNNSGYYDNIGITQLLTVPYAIVAKTIKELPEELKYTAGDGISISKNAITNSKPDKDVVLTAGTGIKITGKYPTFTIASTDATNATNYKAGEGISISKDTIKNTKPDQLVTLTAGNGISITGTYPNFTLSTTNTGSGNGGLLPFDSTDLLIKGSNSLNKIICDTNLNGSGARLVWFGSKGAFRAGWVGEDINENISEKLWYCDSVGVMSTAFGNSNYAKGVQSFAIGKYNRAIGENSIVGGYKNTAGAVATNAIVFGERNVILSHNSMSIGTGNIFSDTSHNSFSIGRNNNITFPNSFAGGETNTIAGQNSIAFGYDNNIFSSSSIAIGANNLTSGNGVAVAIGINNKATNINTFAIGQNSVASGINSFAFGTSANTNDKLGAFVFSDGNMDTLSAIDNNSISMRFAGGYRLFTSNKNTIGTRLNANSNAWSTISDSTLKENFLYLDGNYFLDKIKELKLGSWNYKGQNPQDNRHYGAMAQEIFDAFGSDAFGTIGEPTSINSADMDGIMLIAIQELIKQNKELKDEVKNLKEQLILLLEKQNSNSTD